VPIASFTGDRGYDQGFVYIHVLHHTRDANIIIHPRSNAVISDKGKWIHRDKHVQKILGEGVHKWRRESGYYQQGKVETKGDYLVHSIQIGLSGKSPVTALA